MTFATSVAQHWGSFDPWLATIIFFAYLVVDGMYAEYTLRVVKHKAFSSASIGALMHFILAFGVLNYVNNYLYVIPLAAGSWVGTYLVVWREQRRADGEA